MGPDELARLPGMPRLAVQLLHNREIRDPAAAREFLSGRFAPGDPFQLKGMEHAADRLWRAVRDREPLAVYGDFDTDGVTATALLVHVLEKLGAHPRPYIPHRVDEGYGLNLAALHRLRRDGVRLVVSVDCGIRSVAEAEAIRSELDLIVTDHHSPAGRLPPAYAVVNPKQPGCAYPYRDLAGVGLAFKLAQAVVARRGVDSSPDGPLAQVVDLVALGTVADLAPLTGENRALVQRGLRALNDTPRPGVAALMAEAGLARGQVDAAAIGFRLGPRLNAAGRLESADVAYRLLTRADPLETKALAEQLGGLNRRRQELTEQTVAEAEAQVAADPGAHLLVAAGAAFSPGIVGLAASRLMEAHYRPSAVVELGPERSRGSCRSIPEFDITAALDECAELLIRHGGHRAAAGFTVATANFDALRCRLQAIAARELSGVERRPALDIDAEIALEELDWGTYELFRQFEPCGVKNPPPLLLSRGVEVRDVRPAGAGQQHLRLALRDRRGVAWTAMFFGGGRWLEAVRGRMDIVYSLDQDTWNGERYLRLGIADLRPGE